MSKKSRKRNKKILAAIGIGLGAAALASKKRDASIVDNENKESGMDISPKTDYITKKDTSKSDVAVEPKKIVNTTRTRMKRPNPKADGEAMGPNETRLYNEKNAMPNTAPPSIDNPYSSRVIKGRIGMGRGLKSGGRAKLKSGGSVKKSMGKALRGGGKVIR